MTEGSEQVAAFYDEYGDALGLTPNYDHLDPVLPDLTGRRVLDAGCGRGEGSRDLAARGGSVVGVDLSEEYVATARERHGDAVEFYQGDFAEGLAFLDSGSFDVVVCGLALAHVPDWDRAFETFGRLLDDGGSVVVHAHHPFVDYLELAVENSDEVTGDSAEYCRVERFGRRWGPDGEVMPLYRRPIGEAVRPALDAGFVLEAFVEPGTGPHETDRYDPREPPRHLLLRFRKRE